MCICIHFTNTALKVFFYKTLLNMDLCVFKYHLLIKEILIHFKIVFVYIFQFAIATCMVATLSGMSGKSGKIRKKIKKRQKSGKVRRKWGFLKKCQEMSGNLI